MKNTEVTLTDKKRFIITVEQLEALLRRQLALARKGNIVEIEILAQQANDLIEKISGSKFNGEPQYKQRCKKLEQLYGDLCLILSSQMNEVSQVLGKIYKGKKTVTLYRDNV